MVLIDGTWDDVVAGRRSDSALGRLRKQVISVKPLNIKAGGGEGSSNYKMMLSMPATPASPATPVTPTAARKDNVWSMFHPGGNLAARSLCAELFDKPHPDSPTVNHGLYGVDGKSEHT